MSKKNQNNPASRWSQNEGFIEENRNEGGSSAMVVLSAFIILVLISAIVLAGTKLAKFLNGEQNVDPVTGSGVSLEIRESNYSQSDAGYSAQLICEKVCDSLVNILIYSKDTDSMPACTQSGLIISGDGYLLTSAAALTGETWVVAVTSDGISHVASVVGRDNVTDTAVLKIPAAALKPAVANSVKVKQGERVVAFISSGSFANTVAEGITGGVDRIVTYRNGTKTVTGRYIQTNLSQCGGFLFNRFGEFVGMMPAAPGELSGLAVPVKTLDAIAGSIIENGYVKGRYRLGIDAREINAAAAKQLGLSSACLQIAYVDPLSNLVDYGVKSGDIILSVDGAPCGEIAALLDAVAAKKEGETLRLNILSKTSGTSTDVSAELIPDNGI